MSYATRKKVGAVVVKDGNIISFGWNGQVSGCPNNCEDGNGVTLPSVIHAEQNAIYKLARGSENAVGAVLYLTLSPCVTCALGVIQSGITRVVYEEQYSDISGIEFLQKAGVKVEQYKESQYDDPDLIKHEARLLQHFEFCEVYGCAKLDHLSTWIFDQVGAHPNRYGNLEDYTLGELQLLEAGVKNIRIVLTDCLGEEVAKEAIDKWEMGDHDT